MHPYREKQEFKRVILAIAICAGLTVSNADAGCRVNDQDISDSYSGDCVSGLAHGKGVAKGVDEYRGEFRNGNKDGQGTYTWGGKSKWTGQIFIGESVDDALVKGVWTLADGSVKSGTFINSKLNGMGSFKASNGIIIKGIFKDDNLQGIGTFSTPRGLLPDQKESESVKLIDNYWVFRATTVNGKINIVDSEDKRTPFQKYQGAYTGAWLICFLTQKLIFLTEKNKAAGIITNPDSFKSDTDVALEIENGLAKMKTEYNNLLPMLTNPEGKKALQEHYVAAIMHVKGARSRPNEGDSAFTERMNEAHRKSDELWVRFEITQP